MRTAEHLLDRLHQSPEPTQELDTQFIRDILAELVRVKTALRLIATWQGNADMREPVHAILDGEPAPPVAVPAEVCAYCGAVVAYDEIHTNMHKWDATTGRYDRAPCRVRRVILRSVGGINLCADEKN